MNIKMNLRKRVIDLITLISSPTQQYNYEKNVPIANVPQELISMWFDVTYHPDCDEFNVAFTEQERHALNDFSQCFKSSLKCIPDSEGVAGVTTK